MAVLWNGQERMLLISLSHILQPLMEAGFATAPLAEFVVCLPVR